MADEKRLFIYKGTHCLFRTGILCLGIFLAHLQFSYTNRISNLQIISAAFAQNTQSSSQNSQSPSFEIVDASIKDIQQAILSGQVTTSDIVNMYLERIKAYNGTCVSQPDGVLGRITPIANAGQINSLMTLNLRPVHREQWGFDPRKARSMTDTVDDDPNMPDVLEVAATLDEEFARTGKLAGPLHGVIFSIKDQYDTFDMRTTLGMDAFYENDRPPNDAHAIKKLRDAGAIILAKANLGEGGSQRSRSSFGGTLCNPYDTTRSPGSSSGGSGSSVAANLVTCSIAEETGGSILHPARNGSAVGLAPTQELVSQDGMFGEAFNHRTGTICRTVQDAARVLEVIAGYDPADERTVFSIGRTPEEPYQSFVILEEELGDGPLKGLRIGVVREFMDKDLFNEAAYQSIDIVSRAFDDLRKLGATIVDPGEKGALFQECADKYVPLYRNQLFMNQFPDQFPEGADPFEVLLDMYIDPLSVPHDTNASPNIRNLGPKRIIGENKYFLNRYLKERGDSNIRNITDLINKANYFTDLRPGTDFTSFKEQLQGINAAKTLDLADLFQDRMAYKTVFLQCMAMHELDAVTYPSSIHVAHVLGNPSEPSLYNSPNHHSIWGVIGRDGGFPTMNVPAGYTEYVYDRDPEGNLTGPVPTSLPVSISFAARHFDEPTLIRIASAYQAATKHRVPPPDFGPLPK
jgi:Asp-tRNA(Asn)/Glu-tRNA(Gln) amidotransferase A subunit family amidase